MGKILQILIIENRDLARAQTFCTRVGRAVDVKEITRKHDARAELLFWSLNLLCFEVIVVVVVVVA